MGKSTSPLSENQASSNPFSPKSVDNYLLTISRRKGSLNMDDEYHRRILLVMSVISIMTVTALPSVKPINTRDNEEIVSIIID